MSIITWLDRIHDRQRRRDKTTNAVAKQLLEELQQQPEPDDPTSLITNITAVGERQGAPMSLAEAKALVDVLVRLPKRQRAVVELMHNGWTPPEIAELLRVPNQIVIHDYALAMGELRKKGML